MNILNGNLDNLPDSLQKYSESELYKFALLEYKFGISLEEANRIINRYGTDSDKLPKNAISEYIRLLKTTIECDNIEDVVNYAIKNNLLEEPFEGFLNARNAEGKILNMFAELYTETLYSPRNEEKSSKKELYIDNNGEEYEIDIYKIQGDFNMNARVEGAYSEFVEPENFIQYYENPTIENHGNCESYIGNDLIAIARNSNNSIIVGYSYIYPISLTSAGPYDLGTENTDFSIFNEHSDFRVPEEMKNHTRHAHNEMVKERLIIDENGDIVKNKPCYIVWIEEDLKEERDKSDWKENREKDEQWIATKKAAAQLGVPIVVIDREHFAERETDKIELMKKLITGEDVDKKYEEYTEQYNQLSKPELIKQLIIKFENNRTGLQFNEKLKNKYFTQEQLNDLLQEIYMEIEQMPEKEKIECLESLKEVISKEYSENIIETDTKEDIASFYKKEYDKVSEELDNLNERNQQNENVSDNLLKLYFERKTTYHDVNDSKKLMSFKSKAISNEIARDN